MCNCSVHLPKLHLTKFNTVPTEKKQAKRKNFEISFVSSYSACSSTRFLYNWSYTFTHIPKQKTNPESELWKMLRHSTILTSHTSHISPPFGFKRNCFDATHTIKYYLLHPRSFSCTHTHTHTIFSNVPKSYFIIIYSLLSSLLLLFLFDCVLPLLIF